MPHASSTIVATYTDIDVLTRAVAALAASQLEPAAFDITLRASGDRATASVLVRFASSPAATDAQVAQARSMLAADVSLTTGGAELDLWMAHIRQPWHEGGSVVRVSWLPAALPDVLRLIAGLTSAGVESTFAGRVMGVGILRIDGTPAAQIEALGRMRASTAVGNVVVLRAAGDVKSAVDVWGPSRDSDPVLRALKRMFDPQGILNSDRGPI
jgi:hypothetical protein